MTEGVIKFPARTTDPDTDASYQQVYYKGGILYLKDDSGNVLPLSQTGESDGTTGTWTPVLTTSGTNFTSVTYNAARAGTYYRIGRLVFVQGLMYTDAVTIGSASGDVWISGLPFTAANNSMRSGGAIALVSGWAKNPQFIRVWPNSTYMVLIEQDTFAGNGTGLDAASDVATGATSNYLDFSAVYLAA